MNNQHEPSKVQRHRKLLFTVGGLVAAGAIIVAAVGLGGGGGKSAAGNNMASMAMAAQTAGKTAGASTPVATDAVNIKNFAFSPATVTVTTGSTVVWTNDDSIQHDITFDGGSIVSSVLNHNDTFSHTFTKAGTYHYICSIHPFMHGTVIVTA